MDFEWIVGDLENNMDQSIVDGKKSWAEETSMVIEPYFKPRTGIKYAVKFVEKLKDRTPIIGGRETLSVEFLIEVDGVKKPWGITAKRLIKILISEELKSPLIGRTLSIRPIGDGVMKEWEVI
jgi:hypothetical protein